MATAPLRLDTARPTRRDRDVNWGDVTRLRGAERKTLAWMSVDESRALTVYAAARVRGASDVVCTVEIEWGHGGASVAEHYPIIHRLRVPLAASMVKIAGRLVDRQGQAPGQNVTADVFAFIASGIDGETLRNTRWVHQTGASGAIARGSERVLRIEGYNAGGADTWLMVFDGPPEVGALPQMATPARAGRRFGLRRFDTQGFVQSVTWSASSSPLLLTPDPSASLRVDAELLR
jgi:hypothetical protein